MHGLVRVNVKLKHETLGKTRMMGCFLRNGLLLIFDDRVRIGGDYLHDFDTQVNKVDDK